MSSQLGNPAGQFQYLSHQGTVPCLPVQHEQYDLIWAGCLCRGARVDSWCAKEGCGARKAASCRAVGWSKTSVLGSAGASSPSACCSWLRSSTAPSESSPASMKGVSASSSPSAVRASSASTVSSDTAFPGSTPA
eukprot:scaffold24364_cov70-Phaeocystis_antarctica.AAC.7